MPKVLCVPSRMCIACRERFSKSELTRIVIKDNVATLDSTMKMQARGMYICKNPNCIEKVFKGKNTLKIFKGADVADLKKKLTEE